MRSEDFCVPGTCIVIKRSMWLNGLIPTGNTFPTFDEEYQFCNKQGALVKSKYHKDYLYQIEIPEYGRQRSP